MQGIILGAKNKERIRQMRFWLMSDVLVLTYLFIGTGSEFRDLNFDSSSAINY